MSKDIADATGDVVARAADAGALKGPVEIVGGKDWRDEVERRLAAGRERLAQWQCPEFRAYAANVLNGSTERLTGYPPAGSSI